MSEAMLKLAAQRDYVAWRDEAMKPRREQVPGGRGNKLTRAPAVQLPAFDPGQDAIDRWRKALSTDEVFAIAGLRRRKEALRS